MKPFKPFTMAVSTVLTLVLTLGMLLIPTAESWAGETITILDSGDPTPACPKGNFCKRFSLLKDGAYQERYSYFLSIGKRNKVQEPIIVTPTVNEYEACLAAYTGGFFWGRIEFNSGTVQCVPGSPSSSTAQLTRTRCQIVKPDGGIVQPSDLYQSTTPVCEEI
ncbi:MAG: hypothetical protein F6J89_13285 [Symploca sp. SIO1C4]|uniref:Uncharacterized protein n=1 Tax=Symploca sp. SIO1C4 TaxID=2607765 RepID=A0A6B3NAF9_9CYAN|nr:hypothetical protein [Symploca sp. SIO1C4]NET04815.1 hypothetical protein [Symploca sp. SIO2B6]